jgi:hypothetical protein
MNQRIRELEKQCWSHYVNGVLIDGHLHFDVEKFAELIVRECADIADRAEPYKANDLIKQHFGVKQ